MKNFYKLSWFKSISWIFASIAVAVVCFQSLLLIDLIMSRGFHGVVLIEKNNAEFIQSWDTNLKYITDKTAYSLIDLARLSHPSLDLSKSIFSTSSLDKR